MPRQVKSALGEDSPLNSVTARLALYTAMAGAAGAAAAIALKRRNSRDAAASVDDASQAPFGDHSREQDHSRKHDHSRDQ